MSRDTATRSIRRLISIAALLVGAAILLRSPVAQAAAQPRALVPPESPSVVMEAFRQGTVIGTGSNRAALVVRYDDGGYQTRCVAFSEEEIGGDELLERAGLDPVYGPTREICSIAGQGCPPEDCFCECPFPNCKYWAYYHWLNNDWVYSNLGAESYVVRNGALEGWSWGEGDFQQGVPPPTIPFDEICRSSDTTATSTPTVTAVSRPQITLTASPQSIAAGQCAVISWRASGATTVLLNGISVASEGSQQTCPMSPQTFILIAANSAGQSDQQVTIQVTGAQSGTAQTTPTMTASATVAAGATLFPTPFRSATPALVARQPANSTPVFATPAPRPIITQPPGPLSQPGQSSGQQLPTPAGNLSPLGPGQPELVGGVPLAPTAEPLSEQQFGEGLLATPTRFVFNRPPTETPRPRRVLGEAGRPTPTPMLISRAGAGPGSDASLFRNQSSGASPRSGDSRALVASRAFSPALLPQYAAYLATLTILLAIGWLVQRRKNGSNPSTVAQRSHEPERFAGKNDRAAQ